ncbi:MAG TPA: hypothetical protein VD999_01065 [Vitreimonas sp.]|nr:hypothetical protein [Vitreimonas sp.]
MAFPLLLTAIRLLIPFSILVWPLAGLLLSATIDMYDWKFFPFSDEASYALYQNWDKTLDFYYWLFALFITFKWSEKTARLLAVGLFGWRIVGMVIFFLSQWRPALFFFPNVFENFVLFYLAYAAVAKGRPLFTSWQIMATVLLSIVVPKLVHEYFMHFLAKQPWEVYDVASWLGLTTGTTHEYGNYVAWGLILHTVTISVLIFYVKKNQAK